MNARRSLRYFGTYGGGGGAVLNLRQELFHSQIDRKRDMLEEFFNGVEERKREPRGLHPKISWFKIRKSTLNGTLFFPSYTCGINYVQEEKQDRGRAENAQHSRK